MHLALINHSSTVALNLIVQYAIKSSTSNKIFAYLLGWN